MKECVLYFVHRQLTYMSYISEGSWTLKGIVVKEFTCYVRFRLLWIKFQLKTLLSVSLLLDRDWISQSFILGCSTIDFSSCSPSGRLQSSFSFRHNSPQRRNGFYRHQSTIVVVKLLPSFLLESPDPYLTLHQIPGARNDIRKKKKKW